MGGRYAAAMISADKPVLMLIVRHFGKVFNKSSRLNMAQIEIFNFSLPLIKDFRYPQTRN